MYSKQKSKINRSSKIKKYASVYNSYVRKTEESKRYKSPTRVRKSVSTRLESNKQISCPTHETKKSLNSYQRFVKSESKKEKYKNLPGKERLTIIANLWKKKILIKTV